VQIGTTSSSSSVDQLGVIHDAVPVLITVVVSVLHPQGSSQKLVGTVLPVLQVRSTVTLVDTVVMGVGKVLEVYARPLLI
jgi:hypothetical protein